MGTGACGYAMADMHFHLDFCVEPKELAKDAAERGLAIFANTVTPQGFSDAVADLDGLPNVGLGLGMHPWWVSSESVEADMAAYRRLSDGRRLFGEVGLDFGKRSVATIDEQIRIFYEICRIASRTDEAVMSIHAIRSAGTVMDILEQTGASVATTCIMHWFSGTSEELGRAIEMGCIFSVNKMMATSRRGREYVRQIPADRLLLETDAPPGDGSPYSARDLETDLGEVLHTICDIKGEDVSQQILTSSARILRM